MKTILVLSVFFSLSSQAAPMRSEHVHNLHSVHAMLRSPIFKRVETVKSMNKESIGTLREIVFSSTESLQDRWRALTILGRVHPMASRDLLERALQSQEWYMRNAAVTVLNYSERDFALKWLRLMMHDPALVVRSSAVAEIREIGGVETQSLLWEKLYSSENYRNGKSLWIRRHIAEALAQFNNRDHEQKFAKLLEDKDDALKPIAASALKKMGSSLIQ